MNFSRCVGTYSSAKFEYMRLFCANVIKLSIKTLGFEDNKKSCSALCLRFVYNSQKGFDSCVLCSSCCIKKLQDILKGDLQRLFCRHFKF